MLKEMLILLACRNQYADGKVAAQVRARNRRRGGEKATADQGGVGKEIKRSSKSREEEPSKA